MAAVRMHCVRCVSDLARYLFRDQPRLTQTQPPWRHAADMRTGVIGAASGSAFVQVANTQVVVGVYGPRSLALGREEFSELGQLFCDVKLAPFAVAGARREAGQGQDEAALSAVLERQAQT